MTTTFEQALRAELMRSIRRPPRRHRARAIVAAGAAGLAVAAATLAGPGPAGADVEISRTGGRIQVVLTDADVNTSKIQAALADEDLDITVVEAPVGPSNVGRFVGEVGEPSDVAEVERVQPVGSAYMGFSLPEDWEGTLTVLLGRRADAGEAYQLFSDAFAAGEPLECHGVRGQRLADAVPALQGYDVAVRGIPGGSLPPTDLDAALRDGLGDWTVVGGLALSGDSLLVTIDADPAEPVEPATC